jgi:hypothetical protein
LKGVISSDVAGSILSTGLIVANWVELTCQFSGFIFGVEVVYFVLVICLVLGFKGSEGLTGFEAAWMGPIGFCFPTLRDEAAKDGAPEIWWLVEENRQRQQPHVPKSGHGATATADPPPAAKDDKVW